MVKIGISLSNDMVEAIQVEIAENIDVYDFPLDLDDYKLEIDYDVSITVNDLNLTKKT